MKKYNTYSADEISNHIQEEGNRDELMKWRSIITAPNFRSLVTQAVQELKNEEKQSGTTYLTKFINNCPADESTMTIRQTQALFGQWCDEQGLGRDQLLGEMYAVLGKKTPKRNCLML
jgi:hypothetical protein